jgi:hypothetical protein
MSTRRRRKSIRNYALAHFMFAIDLSIASSAACICFVSFFLYDRMSPFLKKTWQRVTGKH